MSAKRVLIIEDEAVLASALAMVVRRLNLEPVLCASAKSGWLQLEKNQPALVILDIGLPDSSGLDFLLKLRVRDGQLPVLIITAHGNLQNAVEAKKRGASGYLVKPFDLQEFQETVGALLPVGPETCRSTRPDEGFSLPSLIGNSSAMQPAFAGIAHAVASDVPVLITGPTGVGKSLAAKVIHHHSPRGSKPFVVLSCASLPENLLESELFGHERGAFTGALASRAGHVERAAGGTLFLDEIGEIPLSIQVKLLRFVEDKIFTRLGGRDERSVNLRVIAATNQHLEQAVAEKRFREDLYYRLKVLEVKLPPLKDRLDDLQDLCMGLLKVVASGRPFSLTDEALLLLKAHHWPGNIRELRNALEHAVALCTGSVLRSHHFPREISASEALQDQHHINHALDQWLDARLPTGLDYESLHEELEQRLLAALLPRFEHKPTVLAKELSINRTTLRKKLQMKRTDCNINPDYAIE